MANLPKLRVQGLGCNELTGTYDFEKARDFPFGQCILVVEEQVIGSYEDLVRLAEQPEYEERDFLNVELLDIIAGG